MSAITAAITERFLLAAAVWPVALAFSLSAIPFLATAAEPDLALPPDVAIELFERDVRPVLVETCQKCHGAEKQESDLRLDSREALLQGGASGAAVVPGKPAESLLVEAIRQSGDLKMPPKSKLAEDKIASIVRWIELGAPWPAAAPVANKNANAARDHWAFQPLTDPSVPTSDDGGPHHHPIDAFVRSKLHSAGLVGSPPASRRALIRRATYDLTGLPPAPDDVERFVSDDDPQAYSQLLERLLASPHYGEQWARHWLDVARYADTKGYVYAREQRYWVHAWAYRDWVVKALNDDMPYDRFLLLQIAADQAAPLDRASLAAMGFLTLGRRFIGVTHDIIDDRIDVVTRTTMGLTVACARCHDHKFDPIPTRDYYSLYGVFQNCSERTVRVAEPTAPDEKLQAFEQELKKREQKLAETMDKRRAEAAARVRAKVADYLLAQLEMHKYPEEGFDQVLEKDDIIPAFVRRWEAYLHECSKANDPIFAIWRQFVQLEPENFSSRAPEVMTWIAAQPAEAVHPVVRHKFTTAPSSIQDVAQRYGQAFSEVDAAWQAAVKDASDKLHPPPVNLADVSLESLRQVLYGDHAPCEVPNEPIVHTETFFDLASCEELWKLQSEVDNWLIQSAEAPAYSVILVDRDRPTPARVFKRGRPSNKGPEAPRQFLELFSGPERQPFQRGSGRLELAQAIIDPRNPLTARVIVNRVWMHHFGAGLVPTPSDFGTRAAAPSHPELLDWLTSRFIEEGWSLKKLHRRIMSSETYCQSSIGPDSAAHRTAAIEADPENRLLWRMNERRLTFEELRDSMLAAIGELDMQRGGKPTEMFNASFKRRTLYGLVDRQFLPSTLRVFDFANPDLHIPQRSDTTVPQQALFFLNDDMALRAAQSLARRTSTATAPETRIEEMYRLAYQRAPSPEQKSTALAFVDAAAGEPKPQVPATAAHWLYGYGGFDESTQRTKSFERLPHFTGSAWQGGPKLPDGKLGWAQLTADGGHAGNDAEHAAIRRWTAPRDMMVSIRSTLVHDSDAGDGIRARLVGSRQGLLATATAHQNTAELTVSNVDVKAGDTIDFAVDILGTLNNDQFRWEVAITAQSDQASAEWNSRSDFYGPIVKQLDPWEQLAQVLFSSNEFMFIE